MKNKDKVLEQTSATPLVKRYDMVAMQIQPRSVFPLNSRFPLRLPEKTEFFRVNPDDSFSASYSMFEDKKYRKIYIVHPEMEAEMTGDTFDADLFLAVNSYGEYFIIYCKYPPQPDEPYWV